MGARTVGATRPCLRHGRLLRRRGHVLPAGLGRLAVRLLPGSGGAGGRRGFAAATRRRRRHCVAQDAGVLRVSRVLAVPRVDASQGGKVACQVAGGAARRDTLFNGHAGLADGLGGCRAVAVVFVRVATAQRQGQVALVVVPGAQTDALVRLVWDDGRDGSGRSQDRTDQGDEGSHRGHELCRFHVGWFGETTGIETTWDSL